jgi:predicted methyltransferase
MHTSRNSLAALLLLVVACGGNAPEAQAPAATVTKSPHDTPPKAGATPSVSPALRAVVDAADRDPDDKKLDAGRKPAELLAFAGIAPGMKVADLAAGGGYTTELLARAVGPSGVVYGQNSAKLLEMFAEKPWAARLGKPVNKNVVKVTREFDEPLPPEATGLDAAVLVLFYHDTYWMNVDRAKMNANVLKALKPGGKFIIVDHSGRAGSGSTEVKTMHRIEESVVREELSRAGFKLDAEGTFLRNPDDKRDWNASPMAAADKRGSSDRFVLSFVKP